MLTDNKVCELCKYSDRSVIHSLPHKSTCMYIVLSGQVHLQKISKKTLTLNAGDTFYEEVLILAEYANDFNTLNGSKASTKLTQTFSASMEVLAVAASSQTYLLRIPVSYWSSIKHEVKFI